MWAEKQGWSETGPSGRTFWTLDRSYWDLYLWGLSSNGSQGQGKGNLLASNAESGIIPQPNSGRRYTSGRKGWFGIRLDMLEIDFENSNFDAQESHTGQGGLAILVFVFVLLLLSEELPSAPWGPLILDCWWNGCISNSLGIRECLRRRPLGGVDFFYLFHYLDGLISRLISAMQGKDSRITVSRRKGNFAVRSERERGLCPEGKPSSPICLIFPNCNIDPVLSHFENKPKNENIY